MSSLALGSRRFFLQLGALNGGVWPRRVRARPGNVPAPVCAVWHRARKAEPRRQLDSRVWGRGTFLWFCQRGCAVGGAKTTFCENVGGEPQSWVRICSVQDFSYNRLDFVVFRWSVLLLPPHEFLSFFPLLTNTFQRNNISTLSPHTQAEIWSTRIQS